MINRNLSVHLQSYPRLDFLPDNLQLIQQLDVVQKICSAGLSLREKHNLRVRLPLLSLEIIGNNTDWLNDFSYMIAEELNVKEVLLSNKINEIADLLLQINFKKIGSKYTNKVKDITIASKNKQWQKQQENILIAGVILLPDEFELKLVAKPYNQQNYDILALSRNDYLIKLSIELNQNLINEGIARDIIRCIQQNRKEANFAITDYINLILITDNQHLIDVANTFKEHISSQVLAKNFTIEKSPVIGYAEKIFLHNLEEGEFGVMLSL
jgi:isoleucyl-tRNA synthetase